MQRLVGSPGPDQEQQEALQALGDHPRCMQYASLACTQRCLSCMLTAATDAQANTYSHPLVHTTKAWCALRSALGCEDPRLRWQAGAEPHPHLSW